MVECFEDSPDHPALPPSGVRLAIEVDDADACRQRLMAKGVVAAEATDKPWGHRSFDVLDPNGIPVTFFSPLS